MDFTSLTDDKLSALILDAQRELDGRRAKKQAAVLASLDARAEAMRAEAIAVGLDPAAVASAFAKHAHPGKRNGRRSPGGGDGRSTVKPKYWNPGDHAQRWAGRGARPKWYDTHLAKGGAPEDMLIPDSAA
jgi:DNA-binding protein H-NS